MSRITGNDAYGLMEAYSAVYQPRLELTEEQVWEEVEEWVNALIEEGYDLSDYTWEEMYKAYIEEARAEGVKPYKAGPTQADVRADAAAARQKHVSGAAKQSGYGPEDKFKSDWKLRATPSSTTKRRDGSVETVSQRMDREQPYKKRMTGELARKQGSRIASAVTRTIEGPGEPQAVTMPRMKAKVSKEIIRKEEVDVYDIILSHLLDEGYANSVDAAEVIMVNMSEEWISSIMIDEGVTLAQYKRKRQEYKDSQSGRRSSRVGLGPAGSEARVERDMETRGAFGTGEYGGTTKNPKKLRKQRAMGEVDEGVTLAQYKRKRQEYKDSQSGRRSSRVGLGPAGSEWRVERDMETRGAFGTGEYGGTTKNPKKLRKQRAMGEHD